MKTEKNTFKHNDFINLLEFLVNSINKRHNLLFNYYIDDNRVSFYDELTRHELLAFLYDEEYYCYSFLTDAFLFDIPDNNYVDFSLDIYNKLI